MSSYWDYESGYTIMHGRFKAEPELFVQQIQEPLILLLFLLSEPKPGIQLQQVPEQKPVLLILLLLVKIQIANKVPVSLNPKTAGVTELPRQKEDYQVSNQTIS